MLVTQQPVFRKFWHAVMPLADLQQGPRPFTLLGENIVLFLDADGQPAALRDRCRHRTAKLSKGWCVDGEGKACGQGAIQCGYHGWTYDRSGQVIRIPGKVALAPPGGGPAKPAATTPAKPAKPPAPEPSVKESVKPVGPSKGEIAKQEQIQRHHRNAQAAFRRQDLDTAIKEWDRVLELDPSNELAQARRQEALDMARRLKELK